MQKEKWHVRELRKFFLQNKYNTIGSVLVSLCFVVWYVFTDNIFVWRTYEPIPDPVLTVRMLSAAVFWTLGLLLYHTRVYQFFYNLLPKKIFKELKILIWNLMMVSMGFFLIPWTIDVANMVLSFAFNILKFVIWLFPMIGIPLVIFVVWFWIKKLWSE